MMKKLTISIIIIIGSLSFILTAGASLTDRGNGLIYDNALDITWMQNANYSGSTMTWDEANAWAGSLIYQGFDDWRLPASDTCTGSGCTGSEMGHLYYIDGVTSAASGQFTDVKPFMYWSSTEYSTDPAQAWRFSMKYGTQGTSSKSLNRYAWAVRNGDSIPAAAPEPSTALLFISGIAALFGFRRKAK